jgi:hypothetical protein
MVGRGRASASHRISLDSTRSAAKSSIVHREINLDGGEITILKSLGLGGAPMLGKLLLERIEMENAEFLDSLTGLIALGYVLSNKVNIIKLEDVEHAFFRVNPSYARDLRDALHGGKRRDEDRTRRRRRG